MPDNRLLDMARQFAAAIEAQDERALRRLVDAYRLMYDRLEGKVDALLLQIEREGVTVGKLTRLTRYQALMEQIDEEVTKYTAFLRTEIELSTDAAIRAGLLHSSRLTAEMVREAGISAEFHNLPASAIRTLLGFLSEGSPLYDRIGLLTGVQAERVREALIEGIGLGYGPREIARLIHNAFGMGLTDALRMTRTANLWSYREAARANYTANSDIVDGWVWYAQKDGRTCGACLAEDGKIHPMSEPLDGHYNCRCAALPYIEGLTELPPNGEAWFRDQSEQTQRAILGPGKYEAWKAGKYEFGQLSKQTADEVYGTMRIERTLRELLLHVQSED